MNFRGWRLFQRENKYRVKDIKLRKIIKTTSLNHRTTAVTAKTFLNMSVKNRLLLLNYRNCNRK